MERAIQAVEAEGTRPTGRVIRFSLPLLLPSLNESLNQHWAKRRAFKGDLAWLVWAALPRVAKVTPLPFPKARVTVTRCSSGKAMDDDNLAGSVKPLLDVLKVNKAGFGIITDDNPECCELIVKQLKVRQREQCTEVVIEEVRPDEQDRQGAFAETEPWAEEPA